MKRFTALCTLFLAAAVPAIAQMARPATMPLTVRPAAPTTAPSEYERLLFAYLAHMDDVIAASRTRAEAEFKAITEDRGRRAKELEQTEAAVIDKLRIGAKENFGGRLDVELPARVTVYPYVIAESPASARIVATLHKERLVREWKQVASGLRGQGRLCPQWVDVLEAALREQSQDAYTLSLIRSVLWTGGGKRPEYRQQLEEAASKDVESLTSLLFEVDPNTGRLGPVIHSDNIILARKLIARGNPLQIRVASAHFMLRLCEYDVATQTCLDVLGEEYRSVLHPNELSAEDSLSDSRLYHARDEALTLLFYGVRGEVAFRYVYERWREGSIQGSTQPATPGAVPPRYKKVFSEEYKLEYGKLQGLVRQARELATREPSGSNQMEMSHDQD